VFGGLGLKLMENGVHCVTVIVVIVELLFELSFEFRVIVSLRLCLLQLQEQSEVKQGNH
jgi:hypothetical protein